MLNPTSVDDICPNPLTYFLTSNSGGTHTDGVCSCVLGSPALGLMEISLRVRHVRCRHLAKKNITPTHQGLVLCVLGSTKWDWGVLHGSSPSDLSKVATIHTNFNHAKCWSFSKNIQSEFAWFSIRHWQKNMMFLASDLFGVRHWSKCLGWWSSYWKPPDDIRWHRTPFGKSKNSSMTSHDHPFNIFQHLSTPGCWRLPCWIGRATVERMDPERMDLGLGPKGRCFCELYSSTIHSTALLPWPKLGRSGGRNDPLSHLRGQAPEMNSMAIQCYPDKCTTCNGFGIYHLSDSKNLGCL